MPFPFFLVGAERSGTTLLRLMLGHHPHICKCNEMQYVAPAAFNKNGVEIDISEYKSFLSLDTNFQLSGYSILENVNFLDIVNDFFVQLQSADIKPIFGATVHHYFDQLQLVWPNSKYIFLIRDPRDVARSCVKMGWKGTAWGGAEYWVDAYDAWSKLSKLLPENRKLEIRYEHLINDPEAILRETCKFLELNYSPRMLDIDKDTTYSKPNPLAAQSWRDTATTEEVMQVEARVGNRLLQSGYLYSGLPPLKLGHLKRMKICIQDMVNRANFRRERYGFLLWLASFVVNRVPSGNLAKKIKVKLQEIDISFHK